MAKMKPTSSMMSSKGGPRGTVKGSTDYATMHNKTAMHRGVHTDAMQRRSTMQASSRFAKK